MSKFKPSSVTPRALLAPPVASVALPTKEIGSFPVENDHSIEQTTDVDHNPFSKIAFYSTLAFLFLRFSFLHEFLSEKLNIDTHLVVIFGGLSFITALASGGLGRAFRKTSTWMWCGFATWMVLASFTSTWRGGSLPLAFSYLRTTFPLVLLIPAVAYNTSEVRKIVNVIGVAGIAVVAIGFTLGNSLEGRLELESGSTSTIGNSNDFAAHLVFIVPAILYFLFARRRSFIVKLLGIPVVAAAVYLILHTGSRGGLVGIIAALLATVIMGSKRVKAGVMIGIPVLCLCAVPFLPRQTFERLEYLFIPDPQGPDESKLQREALFWASVHITLSHPLLGVGPGRFEEFEAATASERGEHGMWHETHNTYTQASSECGIPALLFLLSALFITLASLRKVQQLKTSDVSPVAATLVIMVCGYATCIIFLSQAYDFNLLAVTGIANALTDAVKRDQTDSRPKSKNQSRVMAAGITA